MKKVLKYLFLALVFICGFRSGENTALKRAQRYLYYYFCEAIYDYSKNPDAENYNAIRSIMYDWFKPDDNTRYMLFVYPLTAYDVTQDTLALFDLGVYLKDDNFFKPNSDFVQFSETLMKGYRDEKE